MEAKLYEVDFGGARYWVSASDVRDAVAVIAEDVPDVETDDVTDAVARELSHEKASARFVVDEDGSRRESMLDAWVRDRSRRVIACSEWP